MLLVLAVAFARLRGPEPHTLVDGTTGVSPGLLRTLMDDAVQQLHVLQNQSAAARAAEEQLVGAHDELDAELARAVQTGEAVQASLASAVNEQTLKAAHEAYNSMHNVQARTEAIDTRKLAEAESAMTVAARRAYFSVRRVSQNVLRSLVGDAKTRARLDEWANQNADAQAERTAAAEAAAAEATEAAAEEAAEAAAEEAAAEEAAEAATTIAPFSATTEPMKAITTTTTTTQPETAEEVAEAAATTITPFSATPEPAKAFTTTTTTTEPETAEEVAEAAATTITPSSATTRPATTTTPTTTTEPATSIAPSYSTTTTTTSSSSSSTLFVD